MIVGIGLRLLLWLFTLLDWSWTCELQMYSSRILSSVSEQVRYFRDTGGWDDKFLTHVDIARTLSMKKAAPQLDSEEARDPASKT